MISKAAKGGMKEVKRAGDRGRRKNDVLSIINHKYLYK